mmetsp:Transcript_6459/g.22857  ORF Transcript_6459/g.22857 Transcript_6459/m.22857 type:complete len:426 (+) Transcript_6459:87-1364(+)
MVTRLRTTASRTSSARLLSTTRSRPCIPASRPSWTCSARTSSNSTTATRPRSVNTATCNWSSNSRTIYANCSSARSRSCAPRRRRGTATLRSCASCRRLWPAARWRDASTRWSGVAFTRATRPTRRGRFWATCSAPTSTRLGTPRPTHLGRTLLHAAAKQGFAEIVASLLQHGASADAQDEAGDTALHCAAAGGPGATSLSEEYPDLCRGPNDRAAAYRDRLSRPRARRLGSAGPRVAGNYDQEPPRPDGACLRLSFSLDAASRGKGPRHLEAGPILRPEANRRSEGDHRRHPARLAEELTTVSGPRRGRRCPGHAQAPQGLCRPGICIGGRHERALGGGVLRRFARRRFTRRFQGARRLCRQRRHDRAQLGPEARARVRRRAKRREGGRRPRPRRRARLTWRPAPSVWPSSRCSLPLGRLRCLP